MCVRNEWFEATSAEALFAVYTAVLPWMARLAAAALEQRIIRTPDATPMPLAATLMRSAEVPAKKRPQDGLSADPLPLFRPRA